MRHKKLTLLTVLILILVTSTSAAEGLFQINNVIQANYYPLFGSGGKDEIRFSAMGVGLKSTQGRGFHGVIDIALLFPYKYEEKIYPAASYSPRSLAGLPMALDAVIGLGYLFDVDPISFLISTGFHTGALFDSGSMALAFGLNLDAQMRVHFGKIVTVQLGGKFNVDFGGMQTLVAGSNQFAGFPISGAFYTGVGLAY